ncbi:MAG: gamma-glutamyltransferase [Paracoccus sp. (in: a-proteobacteria)]|uniref:gamma-glutamyltransferase family protein n=1 Tax=Paracoccus sp. TaxID=267 RepID=UPI0026E0D9DF|nr:gamma-glutamyltransferase [Paracoccus sp. (in: a-proteobacteria)]MDO5614340.1 gamma-glutamyltransferase [Paracoccus sp. (in: a-proteobacteria)]
MQPIVTTPHPLASAAGAEVLRRGGNATEAAVAIGTVLTVVMPHFCGLGGDAVWLLADREGRQVALMGIGQAPQHLPMLSDPISLRGPGAALTTACVADTWNQALRFWGSNMDPADLLAPALRLARDGYTPGPSQDFWLDFRASEWPHWPGFARIFGHRGSDGPLRQPELAEIIALLAQDGLRSFYKGRAAQRIAQGLAQAGIQLSAEDLAQTRCRFETPLRASYRGIELLAPPPPTQGASTLAIMAVLDRLAPADTPAERLHLLVEAVKQAFLDRPLIADPPAMDPAALLDPVRLEAKARAIDPGRSLDWPHCYRHGDTVFYAVCDGQGRCVSALQSTYFDWGSGVVAGDTGILWHNRGAAFSVQSNDPNRIAPGKRPFYTLNPGIALKDGQPHLLYGTQGADGQPQTLARLLTGLIDDDLTPEQALAQPRFLLGKTFSDSRDILKLEVSLGAGTIRHLRQIGHQITELPELSPICGCAGVIDITASLAAHDPRGEGCAVVLD